MDTTRRTGARAMVAGVLLLLVGVLGPRPAAAADGLLGRVVDLEAGAGHTCALLTDGSVLCWGWSELGQLGDGEYVPFQADPQEVVGLDDIVQISAGEAHTCALHETGAVSCWGYNETGQLGRGEGGAVPQLVPGIDDAVAVTAGSDHTCAVLARERLACWGANETNQLSIGLGTEQRTEPTTLAWIDVVDAAAGANHTCFLQSDRDLYCVGSAWFALGTNGPPDIVELPVEPVMTDVVEVEAGAYGTCAVRVDASIWCWGNDLWQANRDGIPYEDNVQPPTRLGGVAATDVSGRRSHWCATTRLGVVECWGANLDGQLGLGDTTERNARTMVPIDIRIVDVAAGGSHTCALDEGRGVWCWGANDVGQLGRAPSADQTSPVRVPGLEGTGPRARCLSEPPPLAAGFDLTAEPSERNRLYRLYCAGLLRDPDLAGFEYWLGIRASGYPWDRIAADIAGSDEFRLRYGDLSNLEFVERLYLDVMNRLRDEEGLYYWTELLDTGVLHRGEVLFYFADSPEFRTITGTP